MSDSGKPDEEKSASEFSGLDGRSPRTPEPEQPEKSAAPAEPVAATPVTAPAEIAEPGESTAGSTPAESRSTTAGDAARRPGRGLLITAAVLVVVLAVATTVAIVSALGYRDDYQGLTSQNAQAQRAEDVASDYAVKAAEIDYRNFDPWFAALKTGVDDAMIKQFADTEPVLRQLLGQLQWVSKGTLVGSDIKSQNNGVYVVQVFVDVQVTNVQSPGGVKTTALYPITVDKNKNWAITDISGGVAPLATK
ncbi:hypothetical protein [Williamsia sp. Leaf354]|uniref:hypothetical protein n=1 Tax=Williamsia sp. Leaf354 TaxID=1736349 RepID=UPI000AC2D7D8|nr:hypothetical protein [Williamsia sp. Leaf354]